MKKSIFIFLLLLCFCPLTASAEIHYSREATGEEITAPVSYRVWGDELSDLGVEQENTYWGIMAGEHEGNEEYPSNTCVLGLSGNFSIPIPTGKEIQRIFIIFGLGSVDECRFAGQQFDIIEEGTPLFTITGQTEKIMGIAEIYTILGFVGSLFADIWVILAIIIGIPLAFYVIQKVQKIATLEKIKEGKIKKQEDIEKLLKESKATIKRARKVRKEYKELGKRLQKF